MARSLPVVRPASTTGGLAAWEVRRIAEQAGCRVIETRTINEAGEMFPVLELDCEDNEHAIRFLNLAARHDAWHPKLRTLALGLRKMLRGELGREPSTAETASLVQRYVQRNVSFVREKDEVFQHALYTLSRGGGDCDDHARLVAALLFACGLEAKIEGVRNSSGAISHVCALVHDGRAWRWVETTLRQEQHGGDARYGEAPLDAARRLGVGAARHDVAA